MRNRTAEWPPSHWAAAGLLFHKCKDEAKYYGDYDDCHKCLYSISCKNADKHDNGSDYDSDELCLVDVFLHNNDCLNR